MSLDAGSRHAPHGHSKDKSILGWQDDPGADVQPPVPPEPRPIPDLSATPLALSIQAEAAPTPRQYSKLYSQTVWTSISMAALRQ